jgi:predicted alpha/beta-hydrolase family hydrolase
MKGGHEMKIKVKSVRAGDHKTSYTYFANDSEAICFMFSGIGYTYDKPLFYYAAMEMRRSGMDIVQVDYHYNRKGLRQPLKKLKKAMLADIRPVIDAVLAKRHYQRLLFLGKSIGTIPIAGQLIKQDEYRRATFILLTPLINQDELFANLLQYESPGLVVIGDRDRFYNADRVERLKQTAWTVETIEGADHSLNVGRDDADASIGALATVMTLIRKKIKENAARR